MPLVSLDEVRAAVAAKITGAYITHNDLVAALESTGNAVHVRYLPRLVRAKRLIASVVAIPGGDPELRYRLPDLGTEEVSEAGLWVYSLAGFLDGAAGRPQTGRVIVQGGEGGGVESNRGESPPGVQERSVPVSLVITPVP
ncbi:MAG: hypothetical protein JXB47_12720 [Anaerolineae bacterium]|nr:hypothetical protein [Anaerolineae bacterium]